jgi:hypothetical protein
MKEKKWKPEMLLCFLQYIGHSPTAKYYLPKMSIVLRLKNTGLECTKHKDVVAQEEDGS